MKTLLVATTAAVGLLASPAMAEPVKLGAAQMTDVTAGLLWAEGNIFNFVQQAAANSGDVNGSDGRHGNGYGGGYGFVPTVTVPETRDGSEMTDGGFEVEDNLSPTFGAGNAAVLVNISDIQKSFGF
jgi:hypothetical protein